MKTIITLAVGLLMLGCGGITKTSQMNTLPDALQVGHNVLERDTTAEFSFPVITEDQRIKLQQKSGVAAPDNTQVIGIREIEGKRTLEAYLVPLNENPNDFEVFLMTCGSDGNAIHCMNLGRFHTGEHKGPMTFGGNRYYTLDTSITFDDKTHFTLHRVMSLTSLYLKNHTLTEAWRVEWDDHYEIDTKGYITFTSQQETYRTDGIDDPMIEQYKSRDWTK